MLVGRGMSHKKSAENPFSILIHPEIEKILITGGFEE
jgi:hypothetical protein